MLLPQMCPHSCPSMDGMVFTLIILLIGPSNCSLLKKFSLSKSPFQQFFMLIYWEKGTLNKRDFSTKKKKKRTRETFLESN